jgi:DNA polymerase III epsilon subunit family exonuclease
MASIDNNFNWNLIPDEFVIFDVETTGLDFSNDRIIEIGAIIFNKKEYLAKKEVISFQVFIKQDKPIPAEAIAINKITDEMVADGDNEFIAISKFFDFIGRRRLFAYNAKFDKNFIEQAVKRTGYEVLRPSFAVTDIYSLAKKYIHNLQNRKLVTIAQHFGYKQTDNAHRAVNDCVMALNSFLALKAVEYAIKKDAVEEANLSIREFEKFIESSNKHLDVEEKNYTPAPVAPLVPSNQAAPVAADCNLSKIEVPILAPKKWATFAPWFIIIGLFVALATLSLNTSKYKAEIKGCINKVEKPILIQLKNKSPREQIKIYENEVDLFVKSIHSCVN